MEKMIPANKDSTIMIKEIDQYFYHVKLTKRTIIPGKEQYPQVTFDIRCYKPDVFQKMEALRYAKQPIIWYRAGGFTDAIVVHDPILFEKEQQKKALELKEKEEKDAENKKKELAEWERDKLEAEEKKKKEQAELKEKEEARKKEAKKEADRLKSEARKIKKREAVKIERTIAAGVAAKSQKTA
jgi:hypothetical protein